MIVHDYMTDCKKWVIARKTFYWTIGHMTIVIICVDLTHHSDKIHPYLQTNLLSTKLKQLLFNMRCRVSDLKFNYRSKYKDVTCRVCGCDEENYMNSLKCVPLLKAANMENHEVEATDIYSSTLSKQVAASQTWSVLLRARDKLSQQTETPSAPILSALATGFL